MRLGEPPSPLGSGPARAGEVSERAVVGDLHDLVDVWGVNQEGASEGDPDVMDLVRGAEEHEVTGLEWCAGGEQRASVVLGLGGAWDLDAGGGVGGVGESGAVETGIAVAAPDVGLAELRAGELDGDRCGVGRVGGGVVAG